MKAGDLVMFRNPTSKDEENAIMRVVEVRETRIVVIDLRHIDMPIVPQAVYNIADLEQI